MVKCAYCGEDFTPSRKGQMYCKSAHRVYASRAKSKRAERVEKLHQNEQLSTMIDRLSKIAPKTAKGIEAFVECHGVECAEAAVRLCLTAYSEAGKVTA